MARDERRNDVVDPGRLLTGQGAGQLRLQLAPGQILFSQGDRADAVFYVESGWLQMSVITPDGKEAVTALRGKAEFLGTRSLIRHRHTATATALTACALVRVCASALVRLLREQPDFAEMFATYLVRQSLLDQEILVNQLTNSAERRLARALVRLADVEPGRDPGLVPARINQTLLAKMVGTTRSRVNFFMNKFKREGLIEYHRAGDIRVRHALHHVLLQEQSER